MSQTSLAGTVRTCATLVSWYFISSTIILVTKWLFNYHFENPLTVTTFSNTLTSVWALLLSRHPKFKPEPLTRKQFREYVVPIGIATALEIGFSNVALDMLSVSFGTILKGGAPIFTMLWGLLLRVETFSANVCTTLMVIAFGIALASFGEGQTFHVLGFVLQLSATALGGLRWAMTHVLLNGNDEHRMPPLTAILYTSPTTAACVFPFALFLEGNSVIAGLSDLEANEFWIIAGVMTLIGTLVFILLMSEYWLVNATSSLALSVAGVFKELLTIGGGILLLSDHLSLLNVIGFVICQVGILGYIWLRNRPESDDDGEIPTTELPLTYGVVSDDADSAEEVSQRLREEEIVVAVK